MTADTAEPDFSLGTGSQPAGAAGATASGRGSGDDDDGARMLRSFRLIGPLMVVGLVIGLVIYCCKMKQGNASVSGSKNKSVELS